MRTWLSIAARLTPHPLIVQLFVAFLDLGYTDHALSTASSGELDVNLTAIQDGMVQLQSLLKCVPMSEFEKSAAFRFMNSFL
jgi:hypothetical protein